MFDQGIVAKRVIAIGIVGRVVQPAALPAHHGGLDDHLGHGGQIAQLQQSFGDPGTLVIVFDLLADQADPAVASGAAKIARRRRSGGGSGQAADGVTGPKRGDGVERRGVEDAVGLLARIAHMGREEGVRERAEGMVPRQRLAVEDVEGSPCDAP